MRPLRDQPAVMTLTNRTAEDVVRPRLGTYLDVATRLGICERQVFDLVKLGRMIEPIRLGRSVKFDLVALDAWIDAGCPPREHGLSVREQEHRSEPTHARTGEGVE